MFQLTRNLIQIYLEAWEAREGHLQLEVRERAAIIDGDVMDDDVSIQISYNQRAAQVRRRQYEQFLTKPVLSEVEKEDQICLGTEVNIYIGYQLAGGKTEYEYLTMIMGTEIDVIVLDDLGRSQEVTKWLLRGKSVCSIDSPIGTALLGRSEGDIIEYNLPENGMATILVGELRISSLVEGIHREVEILSLSFDILYL